MRIRTKVALGTSFALGYYFGAKAGRERYEQLRKGLDALPVGKAVGKARALGGLAIERVRSLATRDEQPVPLRPVTSPEDAARAAQLSSK